MLRVGHCGALRIALFILGVSSKYSLGALTLKEQFLLCISMLTAGWIVTLRRSCFTPGCVFSLTVVVAHDTAGLSLEKVSALSILLWTRGTGVPLSPWFLFCLSLVGVLPTCYLSARRPWRERSVCSSTRVLTWVEVQQETFGCQISCNNIFRLLCRNYDVFEGFTDYCCAADYLQCLLPGYPVLGYLFPFESVGNPHVQVATSNYSW